MAPTQKLRLRHVVCPSSRNDGGEVPPPEKVPMFRPHVRGIRAPHLVATSPEAMAPQDEGVEAGVVERLNKTPVEKDEPDDMPDWLRCTPDLEPLQDGATIPDFTSATRRENYPMAYTVPLEPSRVFVAEAYLGTNAACDVTPDHVLRRHGVSSSYYKLAYLIAREGIDVTAVACLAEGEKARWQQCARCKIRPASETALRGRTFRRASPRSLRISRAKSSACQR